MKTIKQAMPRSLADSAELAGRVGKIIEEVRALGDQALQTYNADFDQCHRDALRVSDQEIAEAYKQVPAEDIEKMEQAASNIRAFAQAQKALFAQLEGITPMAGITLGHRVIPVDGCCCYVPGGSYPLYSTALMLGIPAKVAGVPRVIGCSPAMKGTPNIHPKTLVAMDMAGMDEIYVVGGAQAVAAATYGTASIKPVDLIVGPGNSYVTEAKRQCFGQIGIDFLAGPSEVLVIADGTANPRIIAADLLAQSEHDKVAKGILVTTDFALGEAVLAQVENQLEDLSTRAIAEQSWEDYGEILLASDLSEAVDYANNYAPEHLEIMVEEKLETSLTEKLRNYGSLFIGQRTAEVFGDYATGTNHTLPTLGAARYTGGLWVGTFLKVCTHQKLDANGVKTILPIVSSLARGEGLEAHARAAEARKLLDEK
jgi:sulfopropanediol 3-dehydrogenase